ncbi:MAG: TULIP family P47-like protein [Acidobacteriota bacterium]
MQMNGWDVIYASNVSQLNQVLAASSAKLLPSFSFEDKTLELSFSGKFGPWSIQPGGSANRINLQVPITSGSLSSPAFSKPISLDGVEPILNLALVLVEGSHSGSQSLTFDITTNSTSPSNKNGDLYVNNPDASGKLAQRDPTGQAAAMIRDWFCEPFVANKEKISFVFATVFTDPDDKPWLRPKATGVSYFESLNHDIQAVGIQTLTEAPWSASGLSTAIDPSLLAKGESMFYALSQAVFMKNLLLPSTAQALNVSTGHLKFNGPSKPSEQGKCSITNNGDIDLPSVDHDGTHYYPKLESYEVHITDNQILTRGSGRFDITGLHDAYVTFDNLEVVNEIVWDSEHNKLGFKKVSQTKPSTDSHIPWYEKSITWVVPLVGLIVNLVMDAVVASIEGAVENAVEGTGSLSVSQIQLDTAVWTGLDHFDVNQAALATAFLVRGKTKSS